MIDLVDNINNKVSIVIKTYLLTCYIASWGYFIYLIYSDTYNKAYYDLLSGLVMPVYRIFIFPILHITSVNKYYGIGLNLADISDWSLAFINLMILSLLYFIISTLSLIVDIILNR